MKGLKMRSGPQGPAKPSGWILAEMLPAMLLGCLLSAFVIQSALAIRRTMESCERALLARHVLAASLAYLARDLRTAGCNPMGTAGAGGLDLEALSSGEPEVSIERDIRGTSVGSLPDGDAEDPDEQIVYRWHAAGHLLSRNGQPLATNVLPNVDGGPPFSVRRRGGRALVSICLNLGVEGTAERLSGSTAVLVRNSVGSY